MTWSELTLVKIAAVVLIVWFGYLMAETFVLARYRRGNYVQRLETAVTTCRAEVEKLRVK